MVNESPNAISSSNSKKLHKILSEIGLGSRREIERWIESGRVRVDGEQAHKGQRITPQAKVEVDGKQVEDLFTSQETRVLVMNKPDSVIVTRNDSQDRKTVFDKLPRLTTGRWLAVGRLDLNTSGLLLLTNNGTLAHRLMHPSSVIDREYAVRVMGQPSDSHLEQLLSGVQIDGVQQSFSDIRYYGGSGLNHWYHVVLMEGRNREVRELFASVGSKVSRLKRVRYGPVVLPKRLRMGQFCEMNAADVRAICDWLAVSDVQVSSRRRRYRTDESLLISFPGVNVAKHRRT